MKILLALFVLLFSSLVVAEDDLNGTSIVCGKIVKADEHPEMNKYGIEYFVLGFDFLKNNIVKLYDNNGIILGEPDGSTFDFTYRINLVSIFIEKWLFIDRKTIDFINAEGEKMWSGEDCIIYKDEKIDMNLIKMEKKLINEITKDNKL